MNWESKLALGILTAVAMLLLSFVIPRRSFLPRRHHSQLGFRTGSGEKADAAAEIMNLHRAVEIGELSASEPHLPGTHRGDMARGRNSSVQAGRFRSPGGGARLFVW
jgi:hypothetical protein